MGRTPDRFPGPREDEELVLEERPDDPPTVGSLRYVTGRFRLRDADGLFNPRIDSAEASAQHEALDALVHRIAEDSHLELVRDVSGRLSSTIHWTDATKTTKVREVVVTRDPQNRVSQLQEKQYDDAGVLVATLTTVLTRSAAGRVTSADLTRS